MSILIKNGTVNGKPNDVLIVGNRIAKIATAINTPAHQVIDAGNKAILPGLCNGHTHAAMTLLRGFADDMKLHEWLTQKIWPIEEKMTGEDVYWGTKLACLEMIKSGTTFASDMYWHRPASIRAFNEMGMRAMCAAIFIDMFDKKRAREQIADAIDGYEQSGNLPDRIRFCLGPHSIYTVSEDTLRWIGDYARARQIPIHMHLSETEKEVKDCLDRHGVRPVEYLRRVGLLDPLLIVAHAIWLDDGEIGMLKESGIKVITNPCANMKLSAGIFRYSEYQRHGIDIGIGTDGPSSNNNLDMLEQLKFLALLEKSRTGDPTAAPAAEIFACATSNAASIFHPDMGEIAVNKLADVILVDLKAVALNPGHNLISDLVYAAPGSVVDTVICDGRLLMKGRQVEGEDEILAQARAVTTRLLAR